MDLIRSRDCILLFKGDSQTVAMSDAMVAGGWTGGQGVQWVDSPNDVRAVTYSKGLYGGFLVWGSDETGDQFTSMTRNQVVYRAATMFSGGCLISTTSYERYTYASRLGGPLVPIVYKANDILYFSLRGLWTNEDELTLSNDPLKPCFFTGFVAQVPKSANNFWLGVQTSL
jgi:hypothetical protein